MNDKIGKIYIKVYTQDQCMFCEIMKSKLSEWGVLYHTVNISEDPVGKARMKTLGVKTVPQVFLEDFHINAGIDTNEFTEEMFYDRLDIYLLSDSDEDSCKGD